MIVDKEHEDDCALFDKWSRETKSHEPPRYSVEDILEETRMLFAYYVFKEEDATRPQLRKRNVRDRVAVGGTRASRGSTAKPPAKRRRVVVAPPPSISPFVEIEPFEPDSKVVAFVREERLRQKRFFVPARDDVGPDAHPDLGVARDKFPLLIDSLVYLKTSDGDHDYFTKLPEEEGPELRKRSRLTGTQSVSGLVAQLKPPFHAAQVAGVCASAALKRFANQEGFTLEKAQAAVESASPVELEKWALSVNGGFTPEWHMAKWRYASERGTRIHAAMEAILQNKLTVETAIRDREIGLAISKYARLIRQQEFSHYTPENLCRAELSLWYEPYDIAGQLDALFWVPGQPGVVDIVDWKGIDAASLEKIDEKLYDYRAQLMMYAWLMRHSPDPVLRSVRIRRLVLVALPPTNDSSWTEARTLTVAYDAAVVRVLLQKTRANLLEALRKKFALAVAADPDPTLETVQTGPPPKRARTAHT